MKSLVKSAKRAGGKSIGVRGKTNMKTFIRRVALAIALLTVPVASATAADRAPLILVSIDGFRPDYLDRGVTPTLSALADGGARAAMRPSFPSVTFPNHYTLVTGLRPGQHGVISNSMFDAGIGSTFSLGRRETVMDRRWWDDAEPIWVTARKQGLRTATLFWPGSEAPIQGVRPDEWLPFQQDVPSHARVDMVLGWLTMPPAERPQFLTLYFDIVDSAGHRHGPDSPEVNAAVAEVDAAMKRLVDGLAARGLQGGVNLVIVADHGMAPVNAGNVTLIDDLVDPGKMTTLGGGAVIGIMPKAGEEAGVAAALLRPHATMTCWRKGELPARYGYDHRRTPPIVCMAGEGWSITTRAYAARSRDADRPVTGAHGYDPDLPSMAALFVANGPDIRPSVRLESFDNVSVYPLLARLLGVTPLQSEGRAEDTAAALR